MLFVMPVFSYFDLRGLKVLYCPFYSCSNKQVSQGDVNEAQSALAHSPETRSNQAESLRTTVWVDMCCGDSDNNMYVQNKFWHLHHF